MNVPDYKEVTFPVSSCCNKAAFIRRPVFYQYKENGKIKQVLGEDEYYCSQCGGKCGIIYKTREMTVEVKREYNG